MKICPFKRLLKPILAILPPGKQRIILQDGAGTNPELQAATVRTVFLPPVLTFLGSWAPNGSCRIMWNHGRSCKIMPLKMPESAWSCLKMPEMPDFVVWEWLKVADAQKAQEPKKHKFVFNDGFAALNPDPPEPFFRNRNQNRASLLNCTYHWAL